jgi:hypothetical protein
MDQSTQLTFTASSYAILILFCVWVSQRFHVCGLLRAQSLRQQQNASAPWFYRVRFSFDVFVTLPLFCTNKTDSVECSRSKIWKLFVSCLDCHVMEKWRHAWHRKQVDASWMRFRRHHESRLVQIFVILFGERRRLELCNPVEEFCVYF